MVMELSLSFTTNLVQLITKIAGSIDVIKRVVCGKGTESSSHIRAGDEEILIGEAEFSCILFMEGYWCGDWSMTKAACLRL
ncbi:hypothetical protein MtrunA17_Chr8g0381751 [Medicago truncatula]|uniref:Uncharacterized protein n=1 Tax=Medicago truncatula TaxID=3880 RepID=A0A072TV86_MEDTR|nr:hypothetical protein MTR_8g089900 [Medicago truncatula]RHN42881.1 hypothetical protein MtrunA17_Chr8g0381751 [Medicago truncatula]